MGGRKAKPIMLQLLEGNKNRLTKSEIEARKAAEAKIKPNADKVTPPSWLSNDAKEIFNKSVEELIQVELITNVDVEQLAVYSRAVAEFAKESQKDEPDETKLDKLSKQIKSWSIEFGLTPSSRAKLAMPKEEEKEKTVEEQFFGDI